LKDWGYNAAELNDTQVVNPLRQKLVSLRANYRSWLFVLVFVLPFSCLPMEAYAQQSKQSYNYTKQGGVSVEQAAAMVRRETGGRVLSAKPVKNNGERGYNVRVLIDGKRVKQYYVDSDGLMSSN